MLRECLSVGAEVSQDLREQLVSEVEGAVVVNSDAPAISYLEETVGSEGHCGVEAELGLGTAQEGYPSGPLGKANPSHSRSFLTCVPRGSISVGNSFSPLHSKGIPSAPPIFLIILTYAKTQS